MTDKPCPKCKSEFRYSTICGYCGRTRTKKKRKLSIMDLPYADDYDQEGISKEERQRVIAESMFKDPTKYSVLFTSDKPKRKFVPSPEPKPKSTIYARSEGPICFGWLLAVFIAVITIMVGVLSI